ncbi:MAG: helix-turn-helix domain-containing protein [Terricaulis sp.]
MSTEPRTDTPPEWLEVAEVAELLRKSERSVRRWCKAGTIPAAQPGGERGAYLINRRALEQLGQARP